MSLTAAEAWALASKVALIDARHCGPQESAAKRAESAALLDRARKLSDDVCLLIDAQAYMETPVQPAAHYATPMSAADKRLAFSKPTKRRGTKPASLAQRLAAACHTLKEP